MNCNQHLSAKYNQVALLGWVKKITISWVAFCLLGPYLVAPWKNNDPKETVKLIGIYPFQSTAPLTFTQRFEAQNPICRGLYSLTFNADFMRKVVQTRAQLDVNGNFSTAVYDDYFTPGFCRWQANKNMRGYKVTNTSASNEERNIHFGESDDVIGVTCGWRMHPSTKEFSCGPTAVKGKKPAYVPGTYTFNFNKELKEYKYGI